MADAIPVHGKGKKEDKAPEATPFYEGTDKKELEAKRSELLAKAKDIVSAEVPDVPDELVNTLGQQKNYGKFSKVEEIPYPVMDRKGEPTGDVRTVIRITH